MSVFDGDMEFKTMYMADYVEKPIKPRGAIVKFQADDCMIVGIGRDALKQRDLPENLPDVMCPLSREYYKNAISRYKDEHPKCYKLYLSKDLDLSVIDNEQQDLKRTEYVREYCKRDDPLLSKKIGQAPLVKQARLKLPEDAYIPDTVYLSSYRRPKEETYEIPPQELSCRPTVYNDEELKKKLRTICRVKTGESTYEVTHSLLGKLIKEHQPYGPSRTEPNYGKWKTPLYYSYRID